MKRIASIVLTLVMFFCGYSQSFVMVTAKCSAPNSKQIADNVLNPLVIMDGGDGTEVNPLNYNNIAYTHAAADGGIAFETHPEDHGDVIVCHYINGDGSSRGGVASAEVVDRDTGMVRKGDYALKLNYDFSNTNGIEGACVGFTKDIVIEGNYKAVGIWVYAPEGTPNLWLRLRCRAGGTDPSFPIKTLDFTQRADQTTDGTHGGVNWVGWKYLECSLKDVQGPIVLLAGETFRVMDTVNSYGRMGRWVCTKDDAGNVSEAIEYQNGLKGCLYLDDFKFFNDCEEHSMLSIVQEEATCSKSGVEYHYCENCDYCYYSEIPKIPHLFGDWITIAAPYCATEGIEKRVCSRDVSHFETRIVPALGHNYQLEKVVAPTCEQEGYTVYKCSRCQDESIEDIIPADGHHFQVVDTIAPTCTLPGSTTYICIHCNAVYSENYSALGHNYYVEKVVNPTCEQEGYTEYQCSRCHGNYRNDVLPALGHEWSGWQIVNAPSCKNDGMAMRMCNRCNRLDTYNISKLEHRFIVEKVESTCTKTGYTLYTCEDCGYSYFCEYKPMKEHDYRSIVTEPTTETQGYTVHTCKDCGFSYVDSITDILPSQMHYIIPSLKDINTTLTVKSRENEYMVAASTGVFALDSIKGDVYRVYASQKNSLTVCVGEYDTKLGEVINNEEVFIPLGDVNGDDVIDIADVSVLLSTENYGQANAELDLTGDNSINIADIAVTLQETNYGKTSVAVV